MHSALGCAPYDRESRRLSSSRLGHCVRACRIFSQIQKTPISLRNSSPNGGIGIRRKYSAGRREENRHSRVSLIQEKKCERFLSPPCTRWLFLIRSRRRARRNSRCSIRLTSPRTP